MKTKLVILWAIMLLGLSGCDLFKKEDTNTPVATDPVMMTSDNDWVIFTREALPSVKKNVVFTVTVSVEAKTDLELLGISEQLPAGFEVISGDTTDFLANAAAGDRIELNYTLKASDRSGEFAIVGFSRAKPIGGEESEQLELSSPVEVR